MSTRCVTICPLDELEPGQAKRFEIEGVEIAVVRVGDDVFAIGDRCTHQNVSLSDGEVGEEELVLECWKHGSLFSLVTGVPRQLPALRPTPVYPTQVDAGDVWVTLP